jgi:hypothetical protein
MQWDLMRGPLHWYHGTYLLFVHDGPSLFALCHGRALQISHSQESSFHDYSDFYLALSNSCCDNPHLTVAHLSLRSCMGVATLVARVDVMNSEIHAHRRHTQYPDTTSPFWFVDNNLHIIGMLRTVHQPCPRGPRTVQCGQECSGRSCASSCSGIDVRISCLCVTVPLLVLRHDHALQRMRCQ